MSDEIATMRMPTVKKELNINTFVLVGGFILTLLGLVWTTAQRNAELSGVVANFADFKSLVSIEIARLDQRILADEAAVGKLDNLEYRITVQEQGTANLARSLDELKEAVNSQVADLRVIREILSRLDPRTRGATD